MAREKEEPLPAICYPAARADKVEAREHKLQVARPAGEEGSARGAAPLLPRPLHVYK